MAYFSQCYQRLLELVFVWTSWLHYICLIAFAQEEYICSQSTMVKRKFEKALIKMVDVSLSYSFIHVHLLWIIHMV